MKKRSYIKSFLKLVSLPISKNFTFFFFMYILGLFVAIFELPTNKPNVTLYPNLWFEQFFDLYFICAIITLIPKHVRRFFIVICYIVIYAISVVDLFCWVKFQSPLSPTMLLLAGETNGREAGEFISNYINLGIINTNVGVLFFILILNLIIIFYRKSLKRKLLCLLAKCNKVYPQSIPTIFTISRLLIALIVIVSLVASIPNKHKMVSMFSKKTVGEVEHELTKNDCAQFYHPCYRLAFSLFVNHLASKQLARLLEVKKTVSIDSCSHLSSNIVLIIGESFGRHHSQQYGYFMPTTPNQLHYEHSGLLTKFTDVVSPWNLTSFVFKNMFSLHVVGQKGEWCDYPLFPQLFRKAGYHVTFITNQFLPKAKEAVYDFSGGFFLNNPELSASMFDTRNTSLYPLDEGLLTDYDSNLSKYNKRNNLIIFHLLGSHVSYKLRYPANRNHFRESDYKARRKNLTAVQRKMLSQYDNSVLYNDSIVDQIIKRFNDKDAIIIYSPDHGEECYEENRGFICRNHSAKIDYKLAHYEFEIPFWIYCTPTYIKKHPTVFKTIKLVKAKPFMTDELPYLLLHLAGIKTKSYKEQFDILSPKYDAGRKRLLKNTTDYDYLLKSYFKQKKNANRIH